eukprot:357676-Chlamydomonas_euryale.AAC.5
MLHGAAPKTVLTSRHRLDHARGGDARRSASPWQSAASSPGAIDGTWRADARTNASSQLGP